MKTDDSAVAQSAPTVNATPISRRTETIYLTPDKPPKGWKKVHGMAHCQGEEIYVSPLLIGYSPMMTILAAGSSREIAMVEVDGHVLAPVSWLMQEKPSLKPDLEKLVARIRHLQANPALGRTDA